MTTDTITQERARDLAIYVATSASRIMAISRCIEFGDITPEDAVDAINKIIESITKEANETN
jgi:hypothetical protein